MTTERALAALPQPAVAESDDEALAVAAKTDPAAFGRLYERHYNRVFRYCRTRTATAEDAADLAQHVFTQAYRQRTRYRSRGAGYLAWLLRIARNAAIDAHRGRRATSGTALAEWDAVEARGPGPEEAAILSEAMADLRASVARLPHEQQEALALRYVAGLSIKEIASVIGKSESAAQMRLWRALNALRKGH